ncbi:MAG: hypothetical protein ACE5GE_14970 [Phycisphaerae bacterium]
MVLRIGGIGTVIFWVASMSWLVVGDIWPALTAGQPPQAARLDLTETISYQVGFFNQYGHRIGTAWTTHQPIAETTKREDTIHVGSFAGLPPTLVEIDSTFLESGALDELHLRVHGHGLCIRVDGERFASMYGFNIRAGRPDEQVRIQADSAGLIGDAFRPFAALPNLKVGQSWRMQVINPLACVTGLGDKFVPMLVEVTGRERIDTPDGRAVNCLVVEASNARAWVDDQGKVIKQQVQWPLGGPITLWDEPFDESARADARRAVPRSDCDSAPSPLGRRR